MFVNGSEIYKFKAKDSEIVSTPLCLGNISKDWSTDNMKKKQDFTVMSMILVLIMMQLMLMILERHSQLFGKEKKIISHKMFVFIQKVFYIESLCLSCKKLIIRV